MLTVKQSSEILGVTEARVRNMIYDGVLPAEKFGNSWSITEEAIMQRLEAAPKSGRPKKNAHTQNGSEFENTSIVNFLYQQCKDRLSGGYNVNLLNSIDNPEEKDFLITVSDYFLQQKQRELIERGVF